MSRISRFVAPFIIIALPAVAASDAGSPSCLVDVAREVSPNQSIDIVTSDEHRFHGKLISVQLEEAILRMGSIDSQKPDTLSFSADEITSVVFRKGKLKPGFMVVGWFGGVLVGRIIVSGSNCEGWNSWNCAGYVAAAGLGGLILGTVLPLVIPSEHQITCRPASDISAPVPRDQ